MLVRVTNGNLITALLFWGGISDYQLSAEFATALLGLDRELLEKSLMFRKITATHSKRKSVFMRPCTAEEAGTRRDCMAKLLYARWEICRLSPSLFI